MVEVIAVEQFVGRAEMGDYLVDMFETGKIISGFGFLKIQMSNGTIIHCPEEYMLDKLMSFAQFHTKYKNDQLMLDRLVVEDFLKEEEMTI